MEFGYGWFRCFACPGRPVLENLRDLSVPAAFEALRPSPETGSQIRRASKWMHKGEGVADQ